MLKRPPPLRLDFSGSESLYRRNAYIMLALVVIAVTFLLLQYSSIWVHVASIRAEDEQLLKQHSHITGEQPPTPQEQESINALGKINQKLLLSWEPMLNAIASAVINDVVLLSFQPNASRKELTMMGAATKIPAVLQFVEKLRAQPNLKDVYLKQHEAGAIENSRFPVHFTITLRWEDPA